MSDPVLHEIVDAMIKTLENDYGRADIREKIQERVAKNFGMSYRSEDIPSTLKDEIIEWLIGILEDTIIRAYKEKKKSE